MVLFVFAEGGFEPAVSSTDERVEITIKYNTPQPPTLMRIQVDSENFSGITIEGFVNGRLYLEESVSDWRS